MSTANKVLIHRWHEEVWNRKRREAIYEMLHPDVTIFGLTVAAAPPLQGPDEFAAWWERLIRAFPDIHVSVESTMAEDDRVTARCSVRGRHTGPGPILSIPPTAKPIAFNGICLAHVKNTQICEAWVSFDFLTLYQQIGLISFPAKPEPNLESPAWIA
jgi:predicted ester cyclase